MDGYMEDEIESEATLLEQEAKRLRIQAKKRTMDPVCSNRELKQLLVENLRIEQNPWPFGYSDGAAISAALIILSVFMQMFYVCTVLSQAWNQTKGRVQEDPGVWSVCRDHYQARSQYILHQIQQAAKTGGRVILPDWNREGWSVVNKFRMGGGSSKSESVNSQSGSIEELHGAEYSYSLLDLRSYHGSTIGLFVVFTILAGFVMYCGFRRYRKLRAEVDLHRMRAGILPFNMSPRQRAHQALREVNRLGVQFNKPAETAKPTAPYILELADELWKRQTAEEEEAAQLRDVRSKL